MEKGDIFLVSELSRLGRNLMEVMSILHDCMERDVKVEWTTVYGYFNRWSKSNIWEKINVSLVRQVRIKSKKPSKNNNKKKSRKETPSAGSIDSQSVKTVQVGGDDIDFDAGKKN